MKFRAVEADHDANCFCQLSFTNKSLSKLESKMLTRFIALLKGFSFDTITQLQF